MNYSSLNDLLGDTLSQLIRFNSPSPRKYISSKNPSVISVAAACSPVLLYIRFAGIATCLPERVVYGCCCCCCCCCCGGGGCCGAGTFFCRLQNWRPNSQNDVVEFQFGQCHHCVIHYPVPVVTDPDL